MADEILRSKHGFGNLVDVAAVLEAGKIDAHDILFLDGKTEPKIGWIDKDGEFRLVDNQNVIVVEGDSLPEVGKAGKVYIFNDEGYFWNGTKFVNFCKPTDLTQLEAELVEKINKALAEAKAYTDEKSEEIKSYADQKSEDVKSYTDQKVEDVKSYADEKVEKVSDEVKHVYEKIKYEITDTPVGTLIDYREDEIRIMCPKDAVFTQQSVGVGGNPNSYYMTFKTYYPNKNVVGYMEHLGDLSDSEILTKSSTDKYGRVYQTTWLALADYDASTDSWTYRGKESSKDNYYGYDYQIDWYDENNVMIGSNSIRINLSNEECHFINEPYYVGSMMKEIDTIIEERIAEVESAYEVIEF